ncbi:hypothetical protein [Rhizobium lentis]|uniref:hypothetical protein n=1 Tax=Rhizobium lentis TaxID=1138194 RepID=UPI001C834053|nr:hypothetical protein [Rhizobium lentis]MBX4956126.1 hypothetical protein [Rhizobium lentis]MBX4985402.1 hypothetical protein [Rhizobium lentis]MBX5003847.1 hypothetical protein [Rhizobium lentis]MBX5030306.1 hypothetical protein [Rhizobium lentis]MBX5035600.1 hypothetical protein [Rhizobium lentis]
MKEKKRVYEALVDGAMEGLTDQALYDFVKTRCPKATSKKIVRASLLALTDPHLRDRNILDVIYALVIKHRLDEGVLDDGEDEETYERAQPPQVADRNMPELT